MFSVDSCPFTLGPCHFLSTETSFLNAEFVVAGDVRGQPVALLPLVEMGTAPPIVPGYDMLRPMNRLSHRHV